MGWAVVVSAWSTLPVALVNIADMALYAAKQQGRNQSVLRLPEADQKAS